MGLKAMNNLLGIEGMREELFSYCRVNSCGECLFKLSCNFCNMDEEEIEISDDASTDPESLEKLTKKYEKMLGRK